MFCSKFFSRFFFAISGTSKSSRYQFSSDWFAKSSSQGALFFRQDQLHIDLFVFFSVFFACFFLFLALLVVAWKIRAEADMRRARRRHAVEMHNMAMRPFSSLSVVFRNCNPGTEISILSSSFNDIFNSFSLHRRHFYSLQPHKQKNLL